jgi:hypothetical protein
MVTGVCVAATTVVLEDLEVTVGEVVVVAAADPVEPWSRFPNDPIFGRTTTTATTAMRIITIMPAARRIFFLLAGFFGRGGAAFGMDEGTSGVGGRSFGEKSRGINRFFAGGAAEGTAVAAGCSGTTGVVETGEGAAGCETSRAGGVVRRGSRGMVMDDFSMSGSIDWMS